MADITPAVTVQSAVDSIREVCRIAIEDHGEGQLRALVNLIPELSEIAVQLRNRGLGAPTRYEDEVATHGSIAKYGELVRCQSCGQQWIEYMPQALPGRLILTKIGHGNCQLDSLKE